MPFPVDIKYIQETEADLNVKFPDNFKRRMIQKNGGEIITDEFEFDLFPFFDKSDKKRISRSCNNISLETDNAKQWTGFPDNSVVIASDGFGNYLILQHSGDKILKDDILFWNHETGDCQKIGDNINELE